MIFTNGNYRIIEGNFVLETDTDNTRIGSLYSISTARDWAKFEQHDFRELVATCQNDSHTHARCGCNVGFPGRLQSFGVNAKYTCGRDQLH